MHVFPGLTWDYIMNEIMFDQLFLWYAQAVRIMQRQHGIEYNVELNDPDFDSISEADSVNLDFTWNEEKKRWE